MVPRLQADQISLAVPNRAVPVLFPMSLSILPGEFIVVLGHNGSGKSSLIKLLSGERSLSSGSISIDKTLLQNIPLAKRAIDVITLIQQPEKRLFSNLTVQENITLWESRFDKKNMLEPSKVLEHTGNPNKFMNLLDQQVSHLSGGEKQYLLLALALAHPPRILFLDEHTSSLDPTASSEIMEKTAKAIEEDKVTTLMVTHKLEDAVSYGSRIIILKEGLIVVDQKKSVNLAVNELREMMK